MTPSIRSMRPTDAVSVLAIYDQGIATGHATFQEAALDWAAWDSAHSPDCRLVAELDDRDETQLLGWAALSPISARAVYAGVREVSLYVASAARGRGVGKLLMRHLIQESEVAGIWTLQAGIFPENRSSLALHHGCDFRTVGCRRRLGQMRHGPMAGEWRDVCLLERRSPVVGAG